MARRYPILITAVAAVSLAAAEGVVPWPFGEAPAGPDLAAQVDDAIARGQLERAEEFLEAEEPGEDREHITVFQADIDADRWDVDALFTFGDAFFEHEFSAIDGWGDGQLGLSRVHRGVRGGRDTFSCAGCHAVGGADGAGTAAQNAFLFGDGARISSTVVRNPPSLLGVGLVQSLADEMTRIMHTRRREAVASARESGRTVRVALLVKGVDFGALEVDPDGMIHTGEVEGVDPDLVVRPLGWKGEFATLRGFLMDAARVHFGVQAHELTEAHRDHPDAARLGQGPDWWDPDEDGIQRELEEGTVTAAAVYLALLESPVVIPPFNSVLRDRWARGSVVFEEIGCDDCHRRTLTLDYSRWIEGPNMAAGEGFEFNVKADGEHPKSAPRVELFSDLKRHDLGPELADAHPSPSGVPRAVFLTRPLWGLADTGPYLHDGRASTVTEAIEAHGGDGEASRAAFRLLGENDRTNLRLFLASLTRMPKLRVSQ